MSSNFFTVGLKVDNHEPADIQRALDLPILGMEVLNLNDMGYADYCWWGTDGILHQFERKTWKDLVSGWDSVEYQLREEHQRNPDARLSLILEGVAEPAPRGVIVYYRRQGQNAMFGKVEGTQPGLYKKIVNGLYGMGEFLEVFTTPTMAATITALSSWYQHDQEDEHSIFRRHLKQINWNPNRHVAALMGLAQNDTGLGPTRCEDLINEYGTVWNVIHENPAVVGSMVKGISSDAIRNLQRKIGRPDV